MKRKAKLEWRFIFQKYPCAITNLREDYQYQQIAKLANEKKRRENVSAATI